MAKIDPYKNKENFLEWKSRNQNRIPEISEINSDLILKYLEDMEKGINIAKGSTKGARSYSRLNSLKNRMIFFSKKFKELYNLEDITKIKEEQVLRFFSDIREGLIKKGDGKEYKSVETYAKIFRAFWHWHQKVSWRKGIEIPDITADLDTREEKPDGVYLTEEQVRKLWKKRKKENL